MTSVSLNSFLSSHLRTVASVDVSAELLLLHQLYPRYSGNKDYKLRNLPLFTGCKGLVTFGGVWSNHLLAVSRYALDNQLDAIAIVRNPKDLDTPLLAQCRVNGMTVIDVSYQEYRNRADATYVAQLESRYPGYLLVSEGGSSAEALSGCEDIASDILRGCSMPSHVVCAVGTGCTVAGIRRGLPASIRVEGEATTRKYAEQKAYISRHTDLSCELFYTPESGRYGELTAGLLDFMVSFEAQVGVPLDPNYSAKALFGCLNRIKAGGYPHGSHIVVVHTGGLVGRLGYPDLLHASPLGAALNL